MITARRVPILSLLVAGLACGDAKSDDPSSADAGVGGPDSGLVNGRLLHVPSPAWEDQVIYFAMIDRFANGDRSNDDQGAGEFDPSDGRKFSGGDLKGLVDQLGYIQSLGATAIWITPPVANMWWDPLVEFGGYHGYWARDLLRVDEHFGTLDTYKDLSDALHRRGMYLIQDVVPNHMGNYFAWNGPYDPQNPTQNLVMNENATPRGGPVAPWNQNDPRNPAHVAAGLYHFTPAIADYRDPVQEKTWAISDLDDIATERPEVRALLRQSYGYWIQEVGVDGFRVDTAKFIEESFWNDFMYSMDASAPGMEVVAARTGRSGFLSFGEIFEESLPNQQDGEEKLRRYIQTSTGPGLDSALQFPLYGELERVVAEGGATALLGYRLERMVDPALFARPLLNPTFIDNHDVARFNRSGGDRGTQQALALVLTLPGIPVIYQGTEQGVGETRQAMFAGGWNNPRDLYIDVSSRFRFLQGLVQLRKDHVALRRGSLEVLSSNPRRPGGIVYRRSTPDETIYMLMNTADTRALVDRVNTGLPAGRVLERLAGSLQDARLVAGAEGRVTLDMPARSWIVVRDGGATEPFTAPAARVGLDTDLSAIVTGPTTLQGTSSGVSRLLVVIDENLETALAVTPGADGRWSAELPIRLFGQSLERHVLSVYDESSKVSVRAPFQTRIPFDGIMMTIDDPMGDDVGPTGAYRYPSDVTFSRQQDLLGVTIASGNKLTLTFRMRELSTTWNPTNNFDHVSFSVYFDVPGRDGTTVLPQLSASTPEGFAWDFSHFAFGWANALYGSNMASATALGQTVAGAPEIFVDASAKTVAFTYNPAPFGLESWRGVRVYVTAWDFDGIEARFRDITPEGGQWSYGGAPEGSPKVMDAIGPFEVPVR